MNGRVATSAPRLGAWAVALLGACGEDEAARGATSVAEDPPRPDTACERFCQAAAESPGCEDPDARCQERCAALETERDPACSGPSDALLTCLALGSFTCVEGSPEPVVDQCLERTRALADCLDLEPCRRLCAAAEAAGCPEGSCHDGCDTMVLRDSCAEVGARFAACHEESGECRQGAFRPGTACKSVAHELSACELQTGVRVCPSYCRLVEIEGCFETSEACRDRCETLTAGECGSEYEGAFACRGKHGLACQDGVDLPSLAPDCETAERFLRECLEG